MSGRSKITRLIPFAIVVSTGLGLLAWKYFANQPQGDVTVTDKGIFGYYPRYEVRFPNISLKGCFKTRIYGNLAASSLLQGGSYGSGAGA